MREYALHILIRILGFPIVFVICYGLILLQYKQDSQGYGALFALIYAFLIGVFFLGIEAVLLLYKRNKKYRINVAILLILLFVYWINLEL